MFRQRELTQMKVTDTVIREIGPRRRQWGCRKVLTCPKEITSHDRNDGRVLLNTPDHHILPNLIQGGYERYSLNGRQESYYDGTTLSVALMQIFVTQSCGNIWLRKSSSYYR
ncbi:hypothetical protein NPIL_292171 [Nephila pilipes]|uniref:Uncharacterized protein n=1 Tax=Nephila pilipes TaxID=299642 RepID=A0A8X6QHY6_NEPPI|nr:hypothetical protein NPIL_292171 [Nephila pilipes]